MNQRGRPSRRSTRCHRGCPSVVEKDRSRISPSVVIATSGKVPNSSHRSIRASRNIASAGSHSSSSLQLPHMIVVRSSIRQLHSIPSDTSPCGLPVELSRLMTGVSSPHSMKIAEPWPRQIWLIGKPISVAANDSKASLDVIIGGLSGYRPRPLSVVSRRISFSIRVEQS